METGCCTVSVYVDASIEVDTGWSVLSICVVVWSEHNIRGCAVGEWGVLIGGGRRKGWWSWSCCSSTAILYSETCHSSVADCACFCAFLLHRAIFLAAWVVRSRSWYASTRVVFKSGNSMSREGLFACFFRPIFCSAVVKDLLHDIKINFNMVLSNIWETWAHNLTHQGRSIYH